MLASYLQSQEDARFAKELAGDVDNQADIQLISVSKQVVDQKKLLTAPVQRLTETNNPENLIDLSTDVITSKLIQANAEEFDELLADLFPHRKAKKALEQTTLEMAPKISVAPLKGLISEAKKVALASELVSVPKEAIENYEIMSAPTEIFIEKKATPINLLAEIQGFNKRALKEAPKTVRRPLPIIPAILQKEKLQKVEERVDITPLPDLSAISIGVLEEMLGEENNSRLKKHIQENLDVKKDAEAARERMRKTVASNVAKQDEPKVESVRTSSNIMGALFNKIDVAFHDNANVEVDQTADEAVYADRAEHCRGAG